MEWNDEGVVLTVRPHGESAAILVLLTREHGRHAGLLRGATLPKVRATLQPGNRVQATWRARLAEHLGTYHVELRDSYAPEFFDDPLKLAGLAAALAVTDRSLPEREPYSTVFKGFLALVAAMGQVELGTAWIAAYIRWELGLLGELGFGLDLSRCAATGAIDGLAFVSPRSGRAVSFSAGQPYREKLLGLPRFLSGQDGGDVADLVLGLQLTGFFLERHVFGAHGEHPPAARSRFIERFRDEGKVAIPLTNTE